MKTTRRNKKGLKRKKIYKKNTYKRGETEEIKEEERK